MRVAIPPPTNTFMAWCLVKHKEKFTFVFVFAMTGFLHYICFGHWPLSETYLIDST